MTKSNCRASTGSAVPGRPGQRTALGRTKAAFASSSPGARPVGLRPIVIPRPRGGVYSPGTYVFSPLVHVRRTRAQRGRNAFPADVFQLHRQPPSHTGIPRSPGSAGKCSGRASRTRPRAPKGGGGRSLAPGREMRRRPRKGDKRDHQCGDLPSPPGCQGPAFLFVCRLHLLVVRPFLRSASLHLRRTGGNQSVLPAERAAGAVPVVVPAVRPVYSGTVVFIDGPGPRLRRPALEQPTVLRARLHLYGIVDIQFHHAFLSVVVFQTEEPARPPGGIPWVDNPRRNTGRGAGSANRKVLAPAVKGTRGQQLPGDVGLGAGRARCRSSTRPHAVPRTGRPGYAPHSPCAHPFPRPPIPLPWTTFPFVEEFRRSARPSRLQSFGHGCSIAKQQRTE